MRHTNAKTSIKITMEPQGGASIQLKWSDDDSVRPKEDVAKEIIGELCKIPDYEWLKDIFTKAGYQLIESK